MTAPQFYTTAEVMSLLRLKSRASLYKRMQSPGFPKPTKLDGGRNLFRVSDITKYIREN